MASRGSWLLLVPVAAGAGLLLAAIGWWLAVQAGGEARGGWARVDFAADCGAAAQGVLAERLDDYGLEHEVVEAPLGFELRLPGLPDDLEHLPRALAARGELVLTVGGEPRPARVRNVGVQLGLQGNPVTLLTLEDALPATGVEARLDGEPLVISSINGGELQIDARGDTPREALRVASDRAVQLRHPMPCAVRVVGARALGD